MSVTHTVKVTVDPASQTVTMGDLRDLVVHAEACPPEASVFFTNNDEVFYAISVEAEWEEAP